MSSAATRVDFTAWMSPERSSSPALLPSERGEGSNPPRLSPTGRVPAPGRPLGRAGNGGEGRPGHAVRVN
jgi:hypothetical protein